MDVERAAVLVGKPPPPIDLVADMNASQHFAAVEQNGIACELRGDFAAGIDNRLHQSLAGHAAADRGQVRPNRVAAAFEFGAAKTAADAKVIEDPLAGLRIACTLRTSNPGRQVFMLGKIAWRISLEHALGQLFVRSE